jgi:hypothetical protein
LLLFFTPIELDAGTGTELHGRRMMHAFEGISAWARLVAILFELQIFELRTHTERENKATNKIKTYENDTFPIFYLSTV